MKNNCQNVCFILSKCLSLHYKITNKKYKQQNNETKKDGDRRT